jgi:type VI secretion system protein ImpC
MDETSGMPEPETPFRVCILGDFSGRVNRGIFETGSALASRRLLVVDRDNFDDVLAKLGVEIHLPIAGNDSPPVTIRFTELDDFHPDRIFEHLEVFQALKETRKKLEDPRTFESAAQPAPPVPEISVTSSSLLDQATNLGRDTS